MNLYRVELWNQTPLWICAASAHEAVKIAQDYGDGVYGSYGDCVNVYNMGPLVKVLSDKRYIFESTPIELKIEKV